MKVLKVGNGYDINWKDFQLILPENFSGVCYIYVDNLNGNIQEDLEKITKIKNISEIKEIIINSNSYKVAEYFNLLLKDFNGKKRFNLLNDFVIRDRKEIDFSKLDYDYVTIPMDYIMYINQNKGITCYNLRQEYRNNIIVVGSDEQDAYPEIQECVYDIIDEIFGKISMDQLDDIDKCVLVSNWIQKNIQFIEGKITYVGDKKYICDDFQDFYKLEDIMTAINKHIAVCNAITKLSVALLSNPKLKCKCNIFQSSNHAFFVQTINNESYIVDNTWCITRNPNLMGESLKSSSFSDNYLLIGEDKINENEHTKDSHTIKGIFKKELSKNSISRERIKESVLKLKTMGVAFEYYELPVFVQYEEKNISNAMHR